MLEGKLVNLRVMEKEDIDFLFECFNDIDFWGENPPVYEQVSKSRLMQDFDNPSNLAILIEWKRFIIRKKDGTRIGIAWHSINQPYGTVEISYFLIPSERGKDTEQKRLS